MKRGCEHPNNSFLFLCFWFFLLFEMQTWVDAQNHCTALDCPTSPPFFFLSSTKNKPGSSPCSLLYQHKNHCTSSGLSHVHRLTCIFFWVPTEKKPWLPYPPHAPCSNNHKPSAQDLVSHFLHTFIINTHGEGRNKTPNQRGQFCVFFFCKDFFMARKLFSLRKTENFFLCL